jgi:hypothetical protein
MSQDLGMIHTSAHTISFDRHTTNTVQVRIMHDRNGLVRVYTDSHRLVRSYTASTYARTVERKPQLPAPSTARSTRSSCCIKLECIQRRRFRRTEEYKKGHPGPPTTPTWRPWWAVWPTGATHVSWEFRLGCQLGGPSSNRCTQGKNTFNIASSFIHLLI